MKKGSTFKRVCNMLRLALPGFLLNHGAYFLIQNHWSHGNYKNGQSKIRACSELPDLTDARNLDARDYLNLANSMAHDSAVNSHNPVCRDYAKTTLDNYATIVEKAGKKDLVYSVRQGFDKDHTWLEIYENDQWSKYETMHEPPVLNPSNVENYREKSERTRHYLNGDPNREAHTICLADGNCHPTLESQTDMHGGVLGLILKGALSGD